MADFTLTLNETERAELTLLLETALKDTRVEVHHTHTPGYREKVEEEEKLLRNLLNRLRGAPASTRPVG